MANQLNHDDAVALLKHYEIGVAEGSAHKGTAIDVTGGPNADAKHALTATVGAHSAHRLCPVTEFLAEAMVTDLHEARLENHAALGRAFAHVLVKLSKMHVDSALENFSLTVLLEGDHYEVPAKSIAITPSHTTKIPHRLSPHANE